MFRLFLEELKTPKSSFEIKWPLESPHLNFLITLKELKQRGAQMFVCLIWGSCFFHRSSLQSSKALVYCRLVVFLRNARWHQEEPSEFLKVRKSWKQFMVSSILPKKHIDVFFCFFICFLEELWILESPLLNLPITPKKWNREQSYLSCLIWSLGSVCKIAFLCNAQWHPEEPSEPRWCILEIFVQKYLRQIWILGANK